MTLKANFIAATNYLNLAETDRTILAAMSRNTHGVIFSTGTSLATITDLQVSPDTGHSVRVNLGRAIIREKSNPTVRGSYFFVADAVEVVSLPVVDTNPFIATVIARVADPQYGTVSGATGPRIDIVKGTPATSPVAASDATIDAITSTPGGWIRLADVTINTTNTGAIPSGQFTDRRLPGGFGSQVNALSTALPLFPSEGLSAYRMDIGDTLTYRQGSWQVPGDAPIFLAAGGGTALPANTDYGVGQVTVSNGSAIINNGLDGITFQRAGLVTLDILFYMADGSGAPKLGWVGTVADKPAQTPTFTGDRATLSRTINVGVGTNMVFGQRCGASCNTTITIRGIFFPVYK